MAKFIVDAATGAGDDLAATPEQRAKNPAAVELGRLGGLRGGDARAKSISAARRTEIARLAAKKRWSRE
ncbi:MAG TPA: histone H1 [Xanthobacteraceae bacterium]|nr:histone H1 [Xanthobacteraceae bacterium]